VLILSWFLHTAASYAYFEYLPPQIIFVEMRARDRCDSLPEIHWLTRSPLFLFEPACSAMFDDLRTRCFRAALFLIEAHRRYCVVIVAFAPPRRVLDGPLSSRLCARPVRVHPIYVLTAADLFSSTTRHPPPPRVHAFPLLCQVQRSIGLIETFNNDALPHLFRLSSVQLFFRFSFIFARSTPPSSFENPLRFHVRVFFFPI